MISGSIWWGQIGNSLRLLTKVTNTLRDCQSAVFQVPQNFPWRQDFYEAILISVGLHSTASGVSCISRGKMAQIPASSSWMSYAHIESRQTIGQAKLMQNTSAQNPSC